MYLKIDLTAYLIDSSETGGNVEGRESLEGS